MFFENKPDTKLYDILQVDKGCSERDLKLSYKKLAMKYHPDRNKGTDKSESENRFKEISRAYNILGNKEKRELYDKYGEEGLNNNMPDMSGFSNMDPFGMFGNLFGHAKKRKTKTKDRVEEISVRLEDIYNNKLLNISYKKHVICKKCDGNGVKDIKQMKQCSICKGSGSIIKMVQLGPGLITQTQAVCHRCNGEGTLYDSSNICNDCTGDKTIIKSNVLKLKLNRSMKDGETVVYSGESDQAPGVDIFGDIILKLNITEHPEIKIYKHKHLLIEKTISLIDALCGVEFLLEHLDKRILNIKYKDIIQPGAEKIIEGEGLEGDLIIRFTVDFPKKIDKERKQYLKKIFKIYDTDQMYKNKKNSEYIIDNHYILEDTGLKTEQEDINTNDSEERVECSQQ
tara:strand:+ start:1336 stop:2532 length:1197 start_codon:yes stop_codon:yes gene_type:complete